MQVKAIRTKKIEVGDDIYKILNDFLPKLNERDVVVISSKIIALCQGDVVKNDGKITKLELLQKESDYYLPQEMTMHGIPLSIKNNSLGSGIDQSNVVGYFVLWPKNLQETTNKIWKYLKNKHELKDLGIVVTDARYMPLRKGLTGIGLSWCGFEPLRDYIGKPDIFGKKLLVSKASILDGIASAAVLNTGEGNEQTPIAIVSEVHDMTFVDRTPTQEELNEIFVKPENDIFAKVLGSVKWIKGGSGF